jgi:hypothetical protein
MSYGYFTLGGIQVQTAGGGQASLGPYSVAFGSTLDSAPVVVNTTATIAVPAGCLGVCISPPAGNTTPSVQFSSVSALDVGYIAPGSPSLIGFDPAHLPANIYLQTSSSVTIQVQFV